MIKNLLEKIKIWLATKNIFIGSTVKIKNGTIKNSIVIGSKIDIE